MRDVVTSPHGPTIVNVAVANPGSAAVELDLYCLHSHIHRTLPLPLYTLRRTNVVEAVAPIQPLDRRAVVLQSQGFDGGGVWRRSSPSHS